MNDKPKSLASLLSNYAPKPSQRFYHRMANSPWNQKEQQRMLSVRRIRFSLALVLAFIAIMAIGVPSVRASISAFLGLGISPSDTIIQPTGTIELSTPVAAISVTQAIPATKVPVASPIGDVDLSTNPNIQQVTGLAGWTILTPTYLPEPYHFDSAYYDATNQLVILTMIATRPLEGSDLTETKSITLVEAKRNDVVPLMVAPSTTIEDVSVANTPAAYAVGAWDSNFVQNANEPNGGHMEWNWRNDLQIQNLFWQRGDIYLVLITDDAQVSKDDLLLTANSMK